ncbi:MAG: D-alanyl-D-alanine carboxypeptidase family protein [Solirubrobacterales bacterium]
MVARFAAGSLVIVAVIASSVVIVRGHDDEAGRAQQAGVVRPPVPTVVGPRINGPPKPVRNRFTVDPARAPTAVRIELKQAPAAGLLFDVRSGRVLWQLHPRRELPIASLTKMLTALLIAERHRPGEMVRITRQAINYEGSGVGVLPQGRRVRLEALLYGLMLVSGNDAAIALAQHDARTQQRFVARMNRRARALGLRCSHFASPSGIIDQGNHSCPLDLATLARLDLANPIVRRIIRTRRARLPFPIEGGVLDLFNINPFIARGDPGVTGVKTGLTDAAGRCYVITARIGGRHLGVVLLDSPDPINQVPRLLQAGARA